MSTYRPADSSGESRRSPRDRSPGRFSDHRGSVQYGVGSPRSLDGQSRSNSTAFSTNRDTFRDGSRDGPRDANRDSSGRDPPRGPRALGDVPSGPRANSFSSEYRGGGRGRARARGWRDYSRDRGRDIDRDYRDRRDDRGAPSFRDDRRDWSDRDRADRDRRDGFRGRGPSPPGRARSPSRHDPRDIRDRRDSRDYQSNFEGDRSRRDSRDGPIPTLSSESAGAPFSYGRGYPRIRGRGRGDWEPRGRGRGYFEDRDYQRGRSRSPDRDRDASRYRKERPSDSWDGTYTVRALPSAPVAQNHSPPPQAPEVPAFGSVTGKVPPTGPRAERAADDRESPSDVEPQQKSKVSDPPTAPQAAQVSQIPTAPKSTRAPAQPVIAPKGPAAQNSSLGPSNRQQATAKTWVRPKSSEPSAAVNIETVKTLSAKIDDKVAGLIRRKPFPKDLHEDEGSDSDSGDDINEDYFEAETRGVQERLADSSLKTISKVFTVATADSALQPEFPPNPTLKGEGNVVTDVKRDEASTNLNDSAENVASRTGVNLNDKSTEDIQAGLYSNGVGVDKPKITEEEALEAVRPRMKTPPLSSLPFPTLPPWDQDKDFLASLVPPPGLQDFVMAELADKADRRAEEIEELQAEYKDRYRDWILFHDSDDPLAVRCRDRWEANKKPAASRAASVAPAQEGRPEGRRGRFATEHDMEMVLKASEREAQEAAEKAAKAKAASEKEAVIPDMISKEDREADRYGDYSNMVDPDRALAVFEVLPPIDNFTEEEREIFVKAMLDTPKQWGRIAEALPGRTVKHCIQHYYLVKHDINFKELFRKQSKGRRKGRGAGVPKAKSNALTVNIAELEEGQEAAETTGERRRPRRAAAPTFAFETAVSESDTATPAPTPNKRGAATPKGDGETTTGRRRGKGAATREKATKQAKNSQPLATAPSAAKTRDEEKSVPVKERQTPLPPEPSRYMTQWDGSMQGQTHFPATLAAKDRPATTIMGGSEILPQGYVNQERLGSLPPNAISDVSQQDRRNVPQTSSYWSVPEQTDFPALLTHFGTDWPAIAKWMGSKTYIMVHYSQVFKDWFKVSTDKKTSRRDANHANQVKNYYQRQIDSGRTDLAELARIADEKRSRGESTGPAPIPTVPVKKRYDSLQRPLGNGMEGIDDAQPTNQPLSMQHASPPQSALTSRFPTLAQASSITPPSGQSGPTASIANKQAPLPQQGQPMVQQIQPGRPRGPTLGYFNANADRTILQPASQSPLSLSDPIRSQRSHLVAQEAQAERQQALRLEEQQQQARQLRFKQENDIQNVNQFEQYSSQPPQPGLQATSRGDSGSPVRPDDIRRNVIPQQYTPRSFPASALSSRSLLGENLSHSASAPMTNSPVSVSRGAMSAPPVRQEQPPAPPQPAGLVAVRRQEPVRKTSSIMSLLNDEPSEPRAPSRPSDARPTPSPIPGQQVYQPPGQAQPTHIRRESSLGDLRGAPQYSRPGSTSQPLSRLNESAYGQAQGPSRQQAGSPLNAAAAPERDYYSHKPFMAQHPQSAASPPPLTMAYQSPQAQQASHRQIAFGQPAHPGGSPGSQYASHPLHSSRHNSFDGRQNLSSSTVQGAAPSGYSGPSTSSQYQTHPTSRFGGSGQQSSQPPQHSYGQLPPQHHNQPAPPSRVYTPTSYDARGYPVPQTQSSLVGMPSQEEDPLRRQLLQREGYPSAYDRNPDDPYRRGVDDRRYGEDRRP